MQFLKPDALDDRGVVTLPRLVFYWSTLQTLM